MATHYQHPPGTFPFAVRTPDGKHLQVIGHFTPLEWPLEDGANDRGIANGRASPVFVLTELGSPVLLPAVLPRAAADSVEWLESESSSAPARNVHSRHSILGSPNLAIPRSAGHSGPTRRRSLPHLMRSKSDATPTQSIQNRIKIGHPQPFLPLTKTPRAHAESWQRPARLPRKSSLEVPRKVYHEAGPSTPGASPSPSLVTTLSNWTIRKRNSMRKKSEGALSYAQPSPALSASEDFGVTPYPSRLAPSPIPYDDQPIRAPLRKRASMPAAWMQTVPREERTQSLKAPSSPSRHASSHSISTEYSNAEAIKRLVAAHARTAPPVPPTSSTTDHKSHLKGRSSIEPSYEIKRKPVKTWSRAVSDDAHLKPGRPLAREASASVTDIYGTQPRVKHLKSKDSRHSLLSHRHDSSSDHSQNVLSYIQTKALSLFRRKLHKTAPKSPQQPTMPISPKPSLKPSPIVNKVKSLVSLLHDNGSATSLSSLGSGEGYDETTATIMQAETVRLGYTVHTITRAGPNPSCPMHGTSDGQDDGPSVSVAPLQSTPRKNGLPRVASASPWSPGSPMLPSSSSEEDIGRAISTDEAGDDESRMTPSRMATVSRARGKNYLLSCPSLLPDSASDSATTSSSSTPEDGNSPILSPYTTPPPRTSSRGLPTLPPPSGPLPPIPHQKPNATPTHLRPVIPQIQVSTLAVPGAASPISPMSEDPDAEPEPVFRLYNPSRERFQEALDRVHDNVWHGSIRETKREHRRDCSMTSLSSEDTRQFVIKRSRKVASSTADDELALTSLLSAWSLCECEDQDAYLIQDNESGVLDTLDW